MNTWQRKALTILSVPLLAVPSAVGVYMFLEPLSGWAAAGMAAAGFELLYIGVNVLNLSQRIQAYARNVALAAVATAILMNTLSHYGSIAVWDSKLAVISIIASAPLAGLAYAVSVLLHKLSEEEQGMTSAAINLSVREQELTRREQDVNQREQTAAHTLASADNYLRQAEQEIASRREELTRREQQPIRIEQVETIKVATAELTWRQFEQVIKQLTDDAPSMSSLRRIVASIGDD